MKVPRLAPHYHSKTWRQSAQSGSVRTAFLVIVAFILGLGISVFWLRSSAKAPVSEQSEIQLSASTKSVLSHLDKPVEVRFYSLLDPSSPGELRNFSLRVGKLLAAYPAESNGKITVIVYDNSTNGSPNTALSDGVRGFNLDKGEGCYLGLALSSEGRKEVIPQLTPEWESAVEADLSRAIGRVTEGGNRAAASASPVRSNVIEQVKQQIPNYTDVSLEEGTRLLREAALKEFSATVTQMQAQVQEAEARLQEAKGKASATEQETALQQLQDTQNAQSRKLKEIAARSQAQVEAWKQLKATRPR